MTNGGKSTSMQPCVEPILLFSQLISEAIVRDNQRWNQMSQHVTYVNNMKSWIQQRINWLNNNIGSTQGCMDVDLPPLVISKIHYHPMDYWGIDGDHFEFIEITNNGDNDVDLTGVYFRELGITYRFPNNSHLAAREALVLCSDSLAFIDYYHTTPFGQYTRKLSNKSENLVLADAWGNIIDEVHYADSLPWPPEADGDGSYLELIDLDLDNSLPESWTLGYDLTGITASNESPLTIYPNPTKGILFVETRRATSQQTENEYRISNMMGQTLLSGRLNDETRQIDLSHLPSGLYLLTARGADGVLVHHKIIKE